MVICGYRLLAKYYSDNNEEMLNKFMECAYLRHYYDPHLYTPKGERIIDKYFKNKKVSHEQFINFAKVLVYAALLVQRQVQYATDDNGNLILKPAACLPIDKDEIVLWILSIFNSRLSELDVIEIYEEGKQFIDLNWNKHDELVKKFESFHYKLGYCYGMRKEYKLRVTDNDKKFIGCFLNRKDDIDEFIKYAIKNGPRNAFVHFKQEHKCVSSDVAVSMLQAYGGMRTKQFERFMKKWEINPEFKKRQPNSK